MYMNDEGTGQPEPEESDKKNTDRKGFFRNFFMMGGLVAAYGLAASFALRYLYPSRKNSKRLRMYVASKTKLQPGNSLGFSTPAGESFILTNTGSGANPIIAFSSRCPHLGCKVHWQKEKERFFCPCHGGAFDKDGAATAGPPQKASQTLQSCDIEIKGDAIYALVEKS